MNFKGLLAKIFGKKPVEEKNPYELTPYDKIYELLEFYGMSRNQALVPRIKNTFQQIVESREDPSGEYARNWARDLLKRVNDVDVGLMIADIANMREGEAMKIMFDYPNGPRLMYFNYLNTKDIFPRLSRSFFHGLVEVYPDIQDKHLKSWLIEDFGYFRELEENKNPSK